MDERRLAELFRDAVRDVPPPSFDEGDVRAESRRAAARQRKSLGVASAAAVALVLGGTVLAVGLQHGNTMSADSVRAAAPAPVSGSGSGPTNSRMAPLNKQDTNDNSAHSTTPYRGGPPPNSIPEGTPTQGGASSGSASPSAGGTPGGCGPVDRELAVALANELPAAAGLTPVPVDGNCPDGTRSAGFLVKDGAVTGLFSVVLVPTEGAAPDFSPLSGVQQDTQATPHGGRLTVVSRPQPGATTAPFADRVADVAKRIAPKY
ncbi:hypothetical protein F0L68_20480 [Solihabitans fulvus]|uniref:Uncharacterized protein n=1 Tax=Solihabitans fulvus TaxID=1892852 RepID=A0A5B2XA82_9PSEU|nr:hypothetical protein [Solihabitans fulvus]KAA2260106.1 hypothetical protein F0L68_20480 [Solihabitans fulvus]